MRDVKFRCWHDGKMYDAVTLNKLMCIAGKSGCVNPSDFAGEYMQFTGRKDCYHKEIYEGDIVSSDFYLPEITCISSISYNSQLMKFVFDSGEQDAFKYGRIKVIGNIHQNPELLER